MIKSKEVLSKKILGDPEKLEKLLQELEEKLKKIPVAGNALSDVPLLISLVRAYVAKEYQEIPINTIVAIIAVLIYVVQPVDLIPDFIPVVGFADDAAAIIFIMKMIHDDLEKYKEWQRDNNKR